MKTSNRVGIRTCSDYSPFGVELDGRTMSGGYRYGYQGSEKDDEAKGIGNSYTTEFRQLDPRLGRWFTIDPKSSSLNWQSPYCSMDNNPILFNDIFGDVVDPVPGEKSGVDNKTAWKKYIKKEKGSDKLKVLAPNGTYVEFDKKLFSFSYSDGKESEEQIKKEGVWQIKNADGHFMWDNIKGEYVENTSNKEPGKNTIPHYSGSIKGSTYAGSYNPSDYSQPSQNSADLAAKVHDVNYDKEKLAGGGGVIDLRSTSANKIMISDCKKVITNYYKGAIDPVTGAKTSKLTLKMAQSMLNSFNCVEAVKKPLAPIHPRNVFSTIPDFIPDFGF